MQPLQQRKGSFSRPKQGNWSTAQLGSAGNATGVQLPPVSTLGSSATSSLAALPTLVHVKDEHSSHSASPMLSVGATATPSLLTAAPITQYSHDPSAIPTDDNDADMEDDEVASEAPDVEVSRKEKRLREYVERLERLNRSFWEHRDELYQEKIELFRQEIRDIQKGVHPDYLESLAILEQESKATILQAQLFRDYEQECAQRVYQLEHETSIQEYTAEKEGLLEKMLGDLEDRKRKLKEERDSFDLGNDASLETNKGGPRKNTRHTLLSGGGGTGSGTGSGANGTGAQGKGDEPRKGKRGRIEKGPVLVFQLKDHEIYDDLGLLRRNTNARKAANVYKTSRK
eukprot:jgi/Hompol1/1151/HPOL_004470-RA